MKLVSSSLANTAQIASEFVSKLKPSSSATVIALQGDLGAGKTSFSQAVGEALGVKESMQSPTFVIEKIYVINFKGFQKLIHIDAYRLEKDEEILHLGWQEIIAEPENLILIEWPENVANVIPQNAIRISLKFIDENTREIEIHES